jgi:hypothetical protein
MYWLDTFPNQEIKDNMLATDWRRTKGLEEFVGIAINL